MNTVTPRIFIAATQQNDGKTTSALGLFAVLRKRLGRIGFIKPVAQRTEKVNGKRVDEDSVLLDRTFGIDTPIEDMSPIAIEPDFTRRYINHANGDFLIRRLQNSFDRASWEKDFCLIEGSGHAGVGSVFDLSNARVAKLLASKVVLVTTGGIGRPIDEVALNQALFDKEGVEIAGVIMNKILPEKFERIRDFAQRGLERLGIELLGAIPEEPLLSSSTLNQISKVIRGRFINSRSEEWRRVRRVVIGAMNSSNLMEHFTAGTLVITAGDREDIILAALSTVTVPEMKANAIAGLILSGDLLPHRTVLDLIAKSNLPVIASPLDSYPIASAIHSMTVKTLPGDVEKIQRIQSLVEANVNVDRLLEKIAVEKAGAG